MAQSLSDIMASLNPTYDAQRAPINAEIAALPGQQAADVAGLETAKTNAFNDVTNAAGSRGALYSGVPVNEEDRYVGEKFLPAEANLKSTYATKGSQLQSELATIGANQGSEARTVQGNQAAAEEKAAYDQGQLELSRERIAATATAAGKAAKPPTATEIRSALLGDIGQYLDKSTTISKPGYAEAVALPDLYKAYQPYGLSPAQINQIYYSTRDARGLH